MTARAKGNPEAVIVAEALAELGSLPGVLLIVNKVGRIRDPWGGPGWFVFGLGEGTPDVVGAVDGRFIGLEFKVPGEDADSHQARLHAAWRALGIYVAVVHSVAEARAAIEDCRRPSSASEIDDRRIARPSRRRGASTRQRAG